MRPSSKRNRFAIFAVITVVLVAGVLTACEPEGPPTTPTLKGAFVPTRSSPTPTATFTPTDTFTPTYTYTPSATFTATATFTPTNTTTFTPTFTLTNTATTTSTYTPTLTPTHTATATLTPAFTPTDTTTLTPTLAPSATPETANNVTPVPNEPLPIVYGDTVGGTITNAQPRVVYVFTGSEGDRVNIRMNAPNGDLDPFLKLLDAEGNELITNDDRDSSVNRDSFIGGFELPADGDYTIVATRFDEEAGIREGDFILSLTEGEADLPPTPERDSTPATPEAADNVLVYGEQVVGTINDDTFELSFTFEGREGDVVTISMLRNDQSETLDSYLKLIAPNGDVLIENDDAEGLQRDSRIDAFELPENGAYTIVATRFDDVNGTTLGSFTLTLKLDNVSNGQTGNLPTPTFAPDVQTTPVSPRTLTTETQIIALGTPIQATIDQQIGAYFFTFEGTQDQLITVEMNALERGLDPLLLLLAPDGRELARNDDRTRFDSNALLDNLRLPITGTYTLLAIRSSRRANEGGQFEIKLNPGNPNQPTKALIAIPLEYGVPIEIEFTQFISEQIVSFYGSAGDTIHLNLERRRAGLATHFELSNPAAALIIGGGNDPEATLTLPADGFYSLFVGVRRGVGRVLVTITKE